MTIAAPYSFGGRAPVPVLVRPLYVPPGIVVPRLRPGLGALDPQASQIASAAASGAALTGVLVGVLAGIPVAGPIAAAIAQIGVMIASAFGGCGQTCVEATKIANEVEDYLKQNVVAYMNAPVHYKSLQKGAVNNFNVAWNSLVRACSNPALADAGRRCISERQRGGSAPWCPKPGNTGCDWFALYLDPIQNDPAVVADPAEALASSLTTAVSKDYAIPLLIAAALVAAVIL